ncbi:hypothetical protein FRC17_009244 [Serendipita sp. 399]|nr:hypothetical protein FRC17_009244 [Serendipita sp. 399]
MSNVHLLPPPLTPRSPSSFGGRGSFSGRLGGGGANDPGPHKRSFGGRPPSVTRSSASHSERDSSWESASTATDTTWNNRFAALGDETTTEDGDETASENSDGLDSVKFQRLVDSVVTQDEEDADYSGQATRMRSPSDVSTNWRRTESLSLISFVEISERDVKKSGMIKDGNLKMWRCVPHNTVFKIHVYVPGTEHEL